MRVKIWMRFDYRTLVAGQQYEALSYNNENEFVAVDRHGTLILNIPRNTVQVLYN